MADGAQCPKGGFGVNDGLIRNVENREVNWKVDGVRTIVCT